MNKLAVELKTSQHVLASQSGKFVLDPYVVYLSLGALVLLAGTIAALAFKLAKSNDKLS